MEYPKPVLSKKEMMKLGFPEDMLLRASRERGQTFAWKLNPLAKNSPLMFDTHGFEKWRQKQCRLATL